MKISHENFVAVDLHHSLDMDETLLKEMWKAGTSQMICLTESVSAWEKKGYTESLAPHFDHFLCCTSRKDLWPEDFFVDEIVRFENASDPDDNSIMYAISGVAEGHFIKGLYIESYGLYHEDLSDEMLERIVASRAASKGTSIDRESYAPESPRELQ